MTEACHLVNLTKWLIRSACHLVNLTKWLIQSAWLRSRKLYSWQGSVSAYASSLHSSVHMPAGRVVLVHRISSISLELNILAAGASVPCTPPHSEEDFNIAGWRLLWWSMVTAKLRSRFGRNVFLTDVGFLYEFLWFLL